MSCEDIVVLEKKEKIAVLTINRPDSMNALNRHVNKRLTQLLADIEQDQDISVVIFTGAGKKAFVAGGDITEMSDLDAMGGRSYALQAKKAVDALSSHPKPIIAAINGYCFGGGLEYAMACDFRVASQKAVFGLPEITIAIMPGSAGTQRLPRLIGMGRAKELIMTGETFDAEQALDMGVVNHVFAPEELMEKTFGIAEKIAARSPVALSLIKMAMDRGAQTNIETGFQFEIDCFGLCFSTEEQKKAMAEFISKKNERTRK
jgi:enoyl-CoA hydratase